MTTRWTPLLSLLVSVGLHAAILVVHWAEDGAEASWDDQHASVLVGNTFEVETLSAEGLPPAAAAGLVSPPAPVAEEGDPRATLSEPAPVEPPSEQPESEPPEPEQSESEPPEPEQSESEPPESEPPESASAEPLLGAARPAVEPDAPVARMPRPRPPAAKPEPAMAGREPSARQPTASAPASAATREPAGAADADAAARRDAVSPAHGQPTYGQSKLPPNVGSLAKGLTRAVPRAASGDRVWHRLPMGKAGSIVFSIEVDAAGKVTGNPTVSDSEPRPPSYLERLVQRAALMLKAGTFALSPEGVQAGSQRFELSAELRKVQALEDTFAEPEDLRQIGRLSEPTRVRPGRANFTYNSGRQVELTIRMLAN